MIVIEIHNHHEVARRESLLARALHRVAPGFIHRQVEQRVAEEIEAQLADRGIQVRIRIHWDDFHGEDGSHRENDFHGEGETRQSGTDDGTRA